MPYLLPSTTSLLLTGTALLFSYGMAATPQASNLCSTLDAQHAGLVSYSQDAAYTTCINTYFYQQARLTPQCIITPKSASDVSRIVKTLAGLKAKAAVRGGGHTPIANAANIENAVTIDLSGMNSVNLFSPSALGLDPLLQNSSEPSSPTTANASSVSTGFLTSSISSSNDSPTATDEKSNLGSANILSAGGGATWGDVYQRLESTGLIAIGGRGTSLGVGGLLTGGSFIHQMPILARSAKSDD